MNLIFVYCIDLRKHTTECLIAQVELMLLVTCETPVDLAVYIFLTVLAETLSHELLVLSYGLLLAQFLHEMLVLEGANELKGHPLLPISKITLSRSMA